MAITRIQNNQITDNTIQANAKVTPGSITGNLFASSVTLNSNITILGNLTVSNNYTQLNSVNTYIGDPLVVYNNGYVGSPSYDVGILVNRNLYATAPYGSVNAAFVWKEADTAFEALMTTETGTTAGAINNSGYANVKLGNLTAVSTTITGAFGIAGAATFGGAVQINNTLGVTGVATFGSNIVANSGTASTNTTTGALVVVGGTGISGDLNTGGVTKHAGNVVITSTTDTVDTTTGALVVQGGASVTKKVMIGASANTTRFSNAQVAISTTSAGIQQNETLHNIGLIAEGVATTNGTSYGVGVYGVGYTAGSSRGTGITGESHVSASGDTGNAVGVRGYANDTHSGGFNIGLYADAANSSSGNYALFMNSGNIYSNASQTWSLLDNTTAALSIDSTGKPGIILVKTTDGAEGVTMSGTLGVTGATTLNSTLAVTGVATVNGNLVAASGTASTSTTTGALVVVGGAGVSGSIIAGGNIVANSGTASSSTATGALVVVGGAGISGALNVGGTATVSGITHINNSTSSTASNNGAFYVDGGVGVGGNIYIGQNATVSGNLTVNGTLTYINTNQEIVSGVEVVAGNLVANSGTASSSTSTGALVVTGGVGISGAINTGSTLTVAGVTTLNSNLVAASGTTSSSTTTGALVVTGGVGVSGAIYNGGVHVSQGNIVAASGTASTSTTTGALVVTGGVGVSGNATIGGDTVITGDAYVQGGDIWTSATTFNLLNATATTVNAFGAATTLNTGNASGTTNMAGIVKVGGNLVASATTTSTSSTTGALVVAGGVGTAGNIYSGGNHTAAYGLYSQGSFNGGYSDGIVVDYTNTLGRISVGPSDSLKIYNNGPAGTELFVIDQSGNIVIPVTTATTNTTTGALVVKGGAGIGGAVIAGGNIVAASGTGTTSTTTGALVVTGGTGISGNLFVGGGVTLNSAKTANYDVTINGKNDNTLFWARSGAAYDQVVFGNSATTSTLVTGAKVIVNTTDSIIVPAGTNAQRPGNAGGTDTAGMVRFNTTSANLEYYNGTGWMNTGTIFTIIADDQITANGSTSYTIGGAVSTNGAIVSINGVIQIPTLAYSISGTTITFTEAVQSGDIIDIRRMSTTQQVTGITSQNGYMGFAAVNGGAQVYTGTNSSNYAPTTYWEPSGAEVIAVANVVISSSGVATGVDSFSATTYRSAKYIIQATNGANYETREVLLIQNGTTANIVQYNAVNTGSVLGVITAGVSAGTATLYYNANNNNTTIRVKKDYMLI